MNRQTVHQPDIGETLPLFELARHSHHPRCSSSLIESAAEDVHMRTAWQLARALKANKVQRQAGRKPPKLSSVQRHKVGNAICEHLLASLREQVVSEERHIEQLPH